MLERAILLSYLRCCFCLVFDGSSACALPCGRASARRRRLTLDGLVFPDSASRFRARLRRECVHALSSFQRTKVPGTLSDHPAAPPQIPTLSVTQRLSGTDFRAYDDRPSVSTPKSTPSNGPCGSFRPSLGGGSGQRDVLDREHLVEHVQTVYEGGRVAVNRPSPPAVRVGPSATR